MERRAIIAAHSGRYRVHINHGGLPFWCSFDYIIRPDQSVPGVAVEIGEAPDEDTTKWFPDVQRGMQMGARQLRDDLGIHLVGILVVIAKVHAPQRHYGPCL